jgi:hypothetical protein
MFFNLPNKEGPVLFADGDEGFLLLVKYIWDSSLDHPIYYL